MADYLPIDLDGARNAGVTVLGDSNEPPLGDQQVHGLPFAVGSDRARCFVATGGDVLSAVEIDIGHPARRVLVLHRLLESSLLEGGPVGVHVADYVFGYADGGEERVAIRERFEIGIVRPPRAHGDIATYGHVPFRAFPDRPPALRAQSESPYEPPGFRQPQPVGYYLFAWANPHPARPLATLMVVPKGPRFVIAAITLGQRDEDPLPRQPARPLVVELAPGQTDAPLAVEVDRGFVSSMFALPGDDVDAYLAAEVAGFGDVRGDEAGSGFAYVTAIPSATVTVTLGDGPRAEIEWRELEEGNIVERHGLRVRVAEDGRNWVRTRVVDDATGTLLPCRVHFRSAEGVPYAPHGHQGEIRNDVWNASLGGDVRLGQAVYAYIDGTCEGWLPRGDVLVDVARGFEYEPLRERITIEPGQQDLTLRLRRWCDLRSQRWFSGDTHVHFLSTQGGHTEAQAEDVAVLNLLLSQWGHFFTNTEEFTGGPSISSNGDTIVYATQENRQHVLGHLTLLGLRDPVMPWCSDGLNEAEFAGSIETTLSHWADRCHAQGGIVVIPHLPVPNGEPAALIATDRVDGVEFLTQDPYFHNEYYRYLNCGYRLPLVGGTDKMSSEVPVGLYRTYVEIPDEEFTYESWCRNLAAGRTFLSGGPIISLKVEGRAIGDVVALPAGGGTVEVHAWAESIFPITRLEIVGHGRVIASTEAAAGVRRLELRERLQIDGHTWIAARTAGGPSYFDSPAHNDLWSRRVMAHTSPIYIACGGEWELFEPSTAQYMLTLVEGSLTHIREMALRDRPGTTTHHHGEEDHLAFLERPFHEAAEAIHRRLHRFGIQH
ncbi:hypothetical protein BH20ACT13_BH20ACT13_18370 [soil metagenome]